MREFKKYPNRRLYDIQQSKYVTVEDIRLLVLTGETITVKDSKSEKDLTRTVLLQIIAEQEDEGHEPILTNRVLEQLIRFYGAPMQSVVGRYIEQSIMTFLEYQEQYRRRVQEVTGGDPLAMMRKALEQNMEFWNRFAPNPFDRDRKDYGSHYAVCQSRSRGISSSYLSITKIASVSCDRSTYGLLTAITDIPAARAAAMPLGESSNARHWPGSTPSAWAQSKKISGAGLPFLRAGWSPQMT